MKLSRIVKIRLLVFMLIAFLISTAVNIGIHARSAEVRTKKILMQSIEDFQLRMEYDLEYDLIMIDYYIADMLSANDVATFGNEMLEAMIRDYFAVYDITVLSPEGNVLKSIRREDSSYQIKKDEQAEAFFFEKLKEKGEYSTFHEHPFSSKPVYSGVIMLDGNYLQMVIPEEILISYLSYYLENATANTRIGLDGDLVVISEKGIVISSKQKEFLGKNLEEMPFYQYLVIDFGKSPEEEVQYFTYAWKGDIYYCAFNLYHGNYLIAMQSQDEVLQDTFFSSILIIISELIIFAVLLHLINILVKKHVVQKVDEVNHALSEITAGKLDTIVSVRGSREFVSLSDDINTMVSSLKTYAENEKKMLEKDLKTASKIQMSALPRVFPPFPHRKEIDLFASISPAKDVGGDFYDFFFVKEDILVFLIADVSGKGIPAALFMMIAKTEIKNLAERGLPVDEVMNLANQKLHEGNTSCMFVTVWIGYLNVKTGHLSYVNAGHNKPFLCHGKERYVQLKERSGIAVALMDGIRYKKFEMDLDVGDKLFLYTDGITEANNQQDELYSEKRLLDYLNQSVTNSARETCLQVNEDVSAFAAGTEQFDDMTMVALTYFGTNGQKS